VSLTFSHEEKSLIDGRKLTFSFVLCIAGIPKRGYTSVSQDHSCVRNPLQ
jgi:hypothetical protein